MSQALSHPQGTITHNAQALYDKLFEGNRRWVTEKLSEDPQFFSKLSKGQQPKYLLIGCSDSRVPPDQLTQTNPGEIFIHRNVANLVVSSDMNLNAVLQYAVSVLKVEHIIVMGHYNCGGVKASMERTSFGLIDKWICHIKDVYRLHHEELDAIQDQEKRFRRMVELNIQEQVLNICKASVVQKRWKEGDVELHVHGWVYDLENGLIKDLNVNVYGEWAKLNQMYSFEFKEDTPASTSAPAPVVATKQETNSTLTTVVTFASLAIGAFLLKTLVTK